MNKIDYHTSLTYSVLSPSLSPPLLPPSPHKQQAELMTEEEARKTRNLFQTARDMIKGRPPMRSEQKRPVETFMERYAKEKRETEERQRDW